MADSDHSPDNIFQFAVLRDPQKFPTDALVRRFIKFDWSLTRGGQKVGQKVKASDLLFTLATIREKSTEALPQIGRAVVAFTKGPNYIDSSQKLYSLYPDFKKVYEWLLAADRTVIASDLQKKLEAAAGVTLQKYCELPDFSRKTLALWENFAFQVISQKDADLAQELTNLLRVHWMALRLLQEDRQLQTGQDVYEAARATILLPREIFPLPRTGGETPTESPRTQLAMATPGRKDLVRIGAVVIELNRLCLDVPPSDPCTPYQYAHWPRTWGKVKPAGIADFKAVQTQLLLYGKGEIAQVENLMKGEKNTHVLRNLDRREQIAVSETESTTQTQSESQTHDTSELSNETSQILKEDMNLDVGVNMSAKFGPVSIQAHTGFTYQNSKETSNKIATKLAKDVMNRALTNITQRVRKQTTVTIIHETEDTATHEMDNSGGPASVSTIYRWIDKYYLARLVNYGPRLMFDFVIPEPAAFYIFSMASRQTEGAAVSKPIPPWEPPNDPALVPKAGLKSFLDIDVGAAPPVLVPPPPPAGGAAPPVVVPPPPPAGGAASAVVVPAQAPRVMNWQRWGAIYGVQNLQPPPPATEVIGISIAHYDTGDSRYAVTSEKLKVPTGYEARDVSVTCTLYAGNAINDQDAKHKTDFIEGQIGHFQFEFVQDAKGTNTRKGQMASETDIIPVSCRSDTRQFAMNIEVTCARTQERLDQWRIDTFNAIMAGYQAQQQAYDDWLKSQETSPGVVIPGHNPDMNREVEKEELKKSCIELLTAQRFESFDAMRSNVSNLSGGQNPLFSYPEFDFDQALEEGKYIRFFEDAFEWPLMSYIFYPYFWGRKPNWVTIKQLDDPDPLFTKFLQAGAARVLVPVREKFDDAIRYYLSNGQVWNGGDVPAVDDPLYVSIADEMKEAAGHFEGAKIVQQWVVKMPTSFVIIDDPNNPAVLPDNRAALNYTGNLDDL